MRWFLCVGFYASICTQYATAISAAVDVTDETWDAVIESSPLVLAGFFAPWCAHCKALKPHWAEVAAHFNGNGGGSGEGERLLVVSVDVVANPNLYWRHDISSYPTLRLFRKGAALTDCGARDAKDLIAWAEAKRRVVVPEISAQSDDEVWASLSLRLLGFFQNTLPSSACFDIVKTICDENVALSISQ